MSLSQHAHRKGRAVGGLLRTLRHAGLPTFQRLMHLSSLPVAITRPCGCRRGECVAACCASCRTHPASYRSAPESETCHRVCMCHKILCEWPAVSTAPLQRSAARQAAGKQQPRTKLECRTGHGANSLRLQPPHTGPLHSEASRVGAWGRAAASPAQARVVHFFEEQVRVAENCNETRVE